MVHRLSTFQFHAFRLLAALLLMSCGKGGSSPASGSFDLVSTSVVPGAIVPINSPIEFRFNKAIDLGSIHFGSIAIQGLPPSSLGAPIPNPVAGAFFIKQGSEEIVVFQPSCPTNQDLSNGGLLAGNLFGSVSYLVTVGGLSGPTNSVVAATDGSKLKQSYSFLFQTPSPPQTPLLDPIPSGPPQVIQNEALPATLPLNLWSDLMDPLLVEIDQPVLAGSINNLSVRMEFDHPFGGVAEIPVAVSLAANCTEENRALLLVTPSGVLPPGLSVRFFLAKEVTGFGTGDSPPTDALFHTAIVQAAAIPMQPDAIRENFEDASRQDPGPPLLDPPAIWGNGQLRSGPLFPGELNGIDIEIGPGSTNGNGGTVVFSTDSGTLKDTNGITYAFANGVIEVRNFRIKAPTPGGSSVLFALGSNPLVIRTSENFIVEAGAFLVVDGQDAFDVAGINLPNLPHTGGAGVCGGGDGGTSSPLTNNSDPRGGHGEGPFREPGGGGRGGESGYGAIGYINDVGGGGGGGHFGLMEQDAQGNWVTFCYSTTACAVTNCPMPLPTSGGCANPNCNGVNQNPSTQGEQGGSGTQCTNQTNPNNLVCDLGGPNGKVCQYGAVSGSCLAQGGLPGPKIFSDGDPSNNFLGRKAEVQAGRIVIQEGELTTPLPGQGGGAGGDTVASQIFPAGPNFVNTDYKAGAGGGGSGSLVVESLRRLEIRGTLRAAGGNGGGGEQQTGGACSAAAGGGGSGGTILLECPGTTVFGKLAKVHAPGGNRGRGCYTVPGQTGGGSFCRSNVTAGRGGAGGKGPIMLAIPFDSDLSNVVSCGGLARPSIRAGALFVEDSNSILQPISCERAALLSGVADPDLQVVLPSFGPRSAAASSWFYLGWSDLVGVPQMEFAGLDANGFVDSSYVEIFASGSAGSAQSASPGLVEIDSPSLVDAVRSAPFVLLGDGFQANSGDPVLTITGATLAGNKLALTLDLSTGPISSIGDWKLLRRYFLPTANGTPAAFPGNTSARILFEGADEAGQGSGTPDPNTLLGPTADLSQITGKKLLRFRVEFDRNVNQSPIQADLPEIGLGLLKIPYSF